MKDILRHHIHGNLTYESSPALNNISPLNLLGDGHFETVGNDQGEYVAFCVNKVNIVPKAYRIKAVNSDTYHSHMKSWYFYGAAQNKSTWIRLDHITDNTDVQGLGKEKTFPIVNNDVYQCYKLELIRSHSAGYPYRLTLDDFDINGVLLISQCSCRNNKSHFDIIVLAYILVNKK